MSLRERLAKLEAAMPRNPPAEAHFPALTAVMSDDMHQLGYAMEDGYWGQLIAVPEVAEMMACDALSPEQGARLGTIARELMAAEKPLGAGWLGLMRGKP